MTTALGPVTRTVRTMITLSIVKLPELLPEPVPRKESPTNSQLLVHVKVGIVTAVLEPKTYQ